MAGTIGAKSQCSGVYRQWPPVVPAGREGWLLDMMKFELFESGRSLAVVGMAAITWGCGATVDDDLASDSDMADA